MLTSGFISRVNSFHTKIKTQNKVIEIQTKAHTICYSYLLIKLINLELSTRLISIRTYSPVISSINKKGTILHSNQASYHQFD